MEGLPGELEKTTFARESQSAARLAAAGARVVVGTDVLLFYGLSAHWEMWALALGGMTPTQMLYSATRTGAEALGLDQHLGSIEVGKLADLQILDRNPLEDIHNILIVSLVMRNGRLYDAQTLESALWALAPEFSLAAEESGSA